MSGDEMGMGKGEETVGREEERRVAFDCTFRGCRSHRFQSVFFDISTISFLGCHCDENESGWVRGVRVEASKQAMSTRTIIHESLQTQLPFDSLL